MSENDDALLKLLIQSQTQLALSEEILKRLTISDFETNRKEWLSIEDLQSFLPGNPAKSTIYNWVSARKIPFQKNGKRLLFNKRLINHWLEHGTKSEPVNLLVSNRNKS